MEKTVMNKAARQGQCIVPERGTSLGWARAEGGLWDCRDCGQMDEPGEVLLPSDTPCRTRDGDHDPLRRGLRSQHCSSAEHRHHRLTGVRAVVQEFRARRDVIPGYWKDGKLSNNWVRFFLNVAGVLHLHWHLISRVGRFHSDTAFWLWHKLYPFILKDFTVILYF